MAVRNSFWYMQSTNPLYSNKYQLYLTWEIGDSFAIEFVSHTHFNFIQHI